jgi:hypothetical protein
VGINKTEYINPQNNLTFTYPEAVGGQTKSLPPNNPIVQQMLNKQSFFQRLEQDSKSDLIISMTQHRGDAEVNAIMSDKRRHISS